MADAAKSWFGEKYRIIDNLDHLAAEVAKNELLIAAQAADASQLLVSLERHDDVAKFLVNVMSLSPYLKSAILKYVASLEKVFETGLSNRIQHLMAFSQAAEVSFYSLNETELMAHLRSLKSEFHMLIALGDLARIYDVSTTTAFLTKLSELTLNIAFGWLLIDFHKLGKITLKDLNTPQIRCGIAVLGMGKMGGCELNYSSDIDIVIYFEPEADGLKYKDNGDPTEILGRLVRRLVRIMQERTGDGYVFRTDLRLRPDPGATPLAINVESALNYYEGRGQNWERAAFIKARPVAGDIDAGVRFLNDLKPFIWRKYLDFAAIADVQSIKRQIHAHKGHGKIAVNGHNLKLGRGGIREIEFFVQTQQLIAGGRAPRLQHRQTIEMLTRLKEAGWIEDKVCSELTNAYHFLRRAEHAVQMVNDEQKHELPKLDEDLAVIAALLGYQNLDEFKLKTRETLQCVERHFGELFEAGDTLTSQAGNLVFTGDEPDPDTLNSLEKLGYRRVRDIWSVVRTWHFGRYRALQSQKAREQLTTMVPSLLEGFSATGNADETLLRFDSFIGGLPSGVQLFAMLNSNRHLLTLLTTILSSAPRLADIITKRPLIFDGLLEPAFFEVLPTKQDIQLRLADFLEVANGYEDTLDRLRIFAAEQRFLIGVRFLTGSVDARTSGKALSDLADSILLQTVKLAQNEVVQKHGVLEGAQWSLVAMGKLGSQEMTAGSDVDLLLIYDGVNDDNLSDGAKPLAASQYFARVTQRLIAALSAPTSEGVLYEVDFRLRPSGNKGPLATSFSAFSKYQRYEAWTWEHMALTRARVVCGDPELNEKINTERKHILCMARDNEKTRFDIVDMRQRLMAEKPASSPWNLKMSRGGIIDIEFIAQWWMLTVLPNCKPELRNSNLKFRHAFDILSAVDETIASKEDKQDLIDTLNFFTIIDQLIKLCSSKSFVPGEAPKGLIEHLCAATACQILPSWKQNWQKDKRLLVRFLTEF
ncbi:MAG: bifunctional [glutamine synthetase] adenylyltransferase/[glutamine synthetase]-adenylyl-L-tyrosine phosphorylase [Ahrensia sp.]|nr:bifunctional [glutamine synthetase] adenylyltransferase/[glutamine synthetase]-adenylyl-L-tyrosine phosphorylase [Ahrensia sp.]